MPQSSMIGDYIISGELPPTAAGPRLRAIKRGKAFTIQLFDAPPEDMDEVTRRIGLASKVDHDNLVRVYETGHHEGSFYTVSEFVGGLSATELLGRSIDLELELKPAQVALISAALCEAMEAIGTHHELNWWKLEPGLVMINPLGDVKVDLDVVKGLVPHAARPEPTDSAGPVMRVGALMAQLVTGGALLANDPNDRGVRALQAAPSGSLGHLTLEAIDPDRPPKTLLALRTDLEAWIRSQRVTRYSARVEELIETLSEFRPPPPDLSVGQAAESASSRATARLVRMVRGASEEEIEIDISLSDTAVPTPAEEGAEGPDKEQLLSSMKGFGVGSGHVKSVANVMTDSAVANIARTTVSGTSDDAKEDPDVEVLDPGLVPTVAMPRSNSSLLWVILAVLSVGLVVASALLIWVLMKGVPAEDPCGACDDAPFIETDTETVDTGSNSAPAP